MSELSQLNDIYFSQWTHFTSKVDKFIIFWCKIYPGFFVPKLLK